MRGVFGVRLGLTTLLAGAVSVALSFPGCMRQVDPAKERIKRAREGRDDLLIAVPWPWSLRQELRYGEGLQMAVDEVNAKGGIRGRKLRLARYDDHESIDQGTVIAQQIVSAPDVVAVIGHLQSYITLEAANLYDQAGLVLLAPTATDPQLTQRGYKRVFRVTFTDNSVGRELANLVSVRRWEKIGIYYIRNDYGRNVANAFEARATELGVSVSARSSYDPSEQAGERTFAQVLTQWKSMDLDAIVVAGEVPSAAIFVAQVRRKGITAVILGGDAMSSPGLMAIAGAAAEGVVVASFFHPDEPRPEVARFRTDFTQKYGVSPDAGAALGYDCVHLLAEAMRRANSAVPQDVAQALHEIRNWTGVTAAFTFDENGDLVTRPIVMSVVRGGRFDYMPRAAAFVPEASSSTRATPSKRGIRR